MGKRVASSPLGIELDSTPSLDTPTTTEKAAAEAETASVNKPPKWYQGIQEKDNGKLKEGIAEEIASILRKHSLGNYHPLFLFDEKDSISSYHADRLYSAASSLKEAPKDILLMINSTGGSIEPAYLIAKALKRLSHTKFAVAVPRRAKSAATLLSLGADEIHMGIMSELGPIDPQFGGLPALALGNALDVIADLTCRFPAASAMFGEYISKQVQIRTLGYYQRVSESAAQYAERLLANKPGLKHADIADRLVNHYKDHSFVIDVNESSDLLGDGMVRLETPEYKASDEVYKFLEFVSIFHEKNTYYWLVGAADDYVHTVREPQK